MKKKILSLAIMLFASMGMIVSAQCEKQKCNVDSVECCKKNKCDKKGSRMQSLFAGLNLTDAQKEQLKALRPVPGKVDKEKVEKSKEPRKEYLNKVKEILTPEQYTQFLENCVMSKDGKKEFRKDFRHKRQLHHHGKKGLHQGVKCDKNCQMKDSIKK